MTRRDHHVTTFAAGGSSRDRTNTAESTESSFLSIRNLGETTDLDDDVDVVSAVGGMRALALKSIRGGRKTQKNGGEGRGGESGSDSGSTPRAVNHQHRQGSEGDFGTPRSSPSPRGGAPGGVSPCPRRDPTFEGASTASAATTSEAKTGSPTRSGSRRRAWTAGDADVPHAHAHQSRGGGGGGGEAVAPIRVLSPDADADASAGSAGSPPPPQQPIGPRQCVDSRVMPPSVLVGNDERASGDDRGENDGVRPLSSRLRAAPILTSKPSAAAPDGGTRAMTAESLSSWLAGKSSERSGGRVVSVGEASFQDEFFERKEEEKSEIAPVNDVEGNGTTGLGGLWGSDESPSASLARRLPPRNEAHIGGELATDDSFRGSVAGNVFRSSSSGARPATIEEEPSVGFMSGTATTSDGDGIDDDASASSPLEDEFADEEVGVQGGETRTTPHHDFEYCASGPVGLSRLDSLTESERGNVMKAVNWVMSPSVSSRSDDASAYCPDGFEDEGMYYMNSPMRTPMSGMGYPGGDGAMGAVPFSPTRGPGKLKHFSTGHDDANDIDGHSSPGHSNLGSRHGDHHRKNKRKRAVDYNRRASFSSKAGDNGYQPVHVCGRRVPYLRWPLLHVSTPSWSRVSSFIVRHAPCFWCSQRFETAATDRAILIRLNVLCTCFAAVQVGAGMASLIVQWSSDGTDEENQLRRESLTPNLWTLNGMIFLLALVGLVLIITMLLTLRVIREVNIAGALRYMWALYWLLPLEILLVVGLFDYHKVTDVWVRHWWATPSLDWFRDRICFDNTSQTKCIVPIDGGEDYQSEEGWCEGNYNATDCRHIRDSAQEDMRTYTYLFMTINGVIGAVLIVLLSLALTLLEGIISKPIVQSSKQTNVPLWLTLPIIGCLVGGSVLLFSPSSAISTDASDESESPGNNVFWIGVIYMTSAGTFFIAALLGWFLSAFSVLNNRQKRQKQIAIILFIVTMVLTALSVAAIFSASLIYSASIVDVGFDDQTRGDISCFLDTANSCTRCEESVVRCPEWTTEEVVKVLQTQLKQSATLAAILSLYAISALRFGFVLRKHLSRYQIDYV